MFLAVFIMSRNSLSRSSGAASGGQTTAPTHHAGALEHNGCAQTLQQDTGDSGVTPLGAAIASIWTPTGQPPVSTPGVSVPALVTTSGVVPEQDASLSSSSRRKRPREERLAIKAAAKKRIMDSKRRFQQHLVETYGENDPIAWTPLQRRTQRGAHAAGFVNDDGGVDVTGYNRHMYEQRARNAGFGNRDGSVDFKGYNRHIGEQSARSAKFVNADGSVDLTGYYRHRTEQSARNYRDAAGDYDFRNADGSGNVSLYRATVSQQQQDDDAIKELLALAGALSD